MRRYAETLLSSLKDVLSTKIIWIFTWLLLCGDLSSTLDALSQFVQVLSKKDREVSWSRTPMRQKSLHRTTTAGLRRISKRPDRNRQMSKSFSSADARILKFDSDGSVSGPDNPDRRHRTTQSGSRQSVQPLVSWRKTRDTNFSKLKKLRPTNNLYTGVMSYRSYRLVDTTATRCSRATGKTSEVIKSMSLKLSSHLFLRNNPIMILDFLSEFAYGANIQSTTESQALTAIPFSREGLSPKSVWTGAWTILSRGRWFHTLARGHQLLGSYAHSMHIIAAISDSRARKQQTTQTERGYATKLNSAVSRCGNAPTNGAVVPVFIDKCLSATSSKAIDY